MRTWACLIVFSAFSAAAGGEDLPPGLAAIDRIFGELESLEGILERCADEKAGAAQAFAAADKGGVSLERIPELSTAPLQAVGQALTAQQRKRIMESPGAVAACQASFAINFQDMDFAEFLRSDNNDGLLAAHAACSALAEKSPAACEKLKEAGFEGPVRECRLAYAELSLVRALASGDPRALKLCLDAAAAPGEKAVSSAKACAGLLARKDPAEVCPKAAFAQEEFREHDCVIAFGLSGKADACSAFDPLWDGWEDHSCRDYAAYAKALAAGDPGLCGERSLCRALMGEGPSACQAIAVRIRDKFCTRLVAGPEISTTVVTRADEEALRRRKSRLSELAREQERVVLDERRRVMHSELSAAAQVRRGESLKKFNEVNSACLKTSKDSQDRIDDIYELLTAFEPKGHPGHKSRLEKFFEAQSRKAQSFERLQAIRVF